MNHADFWTRINGIISDDFAAEGLAELDEYADKFICGQLLYQRFSPAEQHGCAAGGHVHVIASLLAGAKIGTDTGAEEEDDFKRQCERGETQARTIELWAKRTGCWTDNVEESLTSLLGDQIAEGGEAHVYDHGATLIKSIGLDYYIEPILALDRVTLHNAYFPETRLFVLGFGKDAQGCFRVLVEQQFIEGERMTDEEISSYAQRMGFKLINPRNWTFATPDIYLSDMHDENVIRTRAGGIAVVDCDIRINTAILRCGGTRKLSNQVLFRSQDIDN